MTRRWNSARSAANRTRLYVGFDLGQKQSHSAIVVLEKAEVTSKDRDPVTFAWIKRTESHLRRAERLPLNMTYPAIADRLLSAIQLLPNTKDVTLVLDATGYGEPFLDLLRKQPIGAHLMPVIITGSGLPTAQGGNYRISKTDLMRSLNYLITSPDFKINAPADQHQADVNEMENLRMLNSALVQDRRPRHGLLARLPASAQIPGGESVAHGRIEYHSP